MSSTQHSASAMRRALRRAADGVSPDVTEASILLAARGADLDQLCRIAGHVRDQGLATASLPGLVTYSRKVFIPLTRLRRDRCHYCTFATTPNRVPAAFLDIDQVVQVARDGAALGCKEALFTLGDRPEERWPGAFGRSLYRWRRRVHRQARQIGSECLIMRDTCPDQPTMRRLACSDRGSSVP